MSYRNLIVESFSFDDDGEPSDDKVNVAISPMTVKYVQSMKSKMRGYENFNDALVYFVDDQEPLPLLISDIDLAALNQAISFYSYEY